MEINLLALLVGFIVLLLAWWAVTKLSVTFGIPPQVVVVIQVVLVIIAVIWLLSSVGLLDIPVRVTS